MSLRFLIDNSVWSRLNSNSSVADAVRSMINTYSADAIMICPPIAAEIGHSARSGADHTALMQALGAFHDCPEHPDTRLTLAIQNALWNRGLLRAAGATDVLIAAYAIVNDATVVHYDGDFEHIATAARTLKHRWILERGSI